MDAPTAPQLIASVRALPAAQALLARLPDVEGIHLVGGAVRDLLLGGRPTDLDLVVEGDAAALASALGPPRIHDRFGTSTVVLDGFSYDLGRARTETYARPGALPDVLPATLAEDLERRDFTVNAAAIALTGTEPGRLTAVPWALDDLDARRLRILHDRSFLDDPTRLLRLARYAARLPFDVEPHTRARADAALAAGALATVTGARVGTELRLLAAEADPLAAFAALRALGLDAAIASSFGIDDADLAWRALSLLPTDGRRDRLVLALASRGIPAGTLARLLDELAFEAGDRDAIFAAATRGPELADALSKVAAPSEILGAVGGESPEAVALAGALGPERPAREWLERLRAIVLEIDGRDLLAAGVPEGPAIGRGLRAALAAKLDGRARGRDAELARALEATGDSG